MSENTLINPGASASGSGCAGCQTSGGWWFHLRRCAACGHVGCCDSSPSQHARRHVAETGHTVITSFEPGELWFYDFDTGGLFEGPELEPPQHHPLDQPVPGPAGCVPSDWMGRLHRQGTVPGPAMAKSCSTGALGPEEIQTISREDLRDKLERGEEIRLIMALNRWAFDAKHIPGSLHFDTRDELYAVIHPDDSVIVYCSHVDCLSSVALYRDLVRRGYRDVGRYAGGLLDWEEAGLPLEGELATTD